MLKTLLFSTLFLVFIQNASASTPVCKIKNLSGVDARYCYQQPSTTSDTLIVFFHGIGGNEKVWFNNNTFQNLHRKLQSEGRLDPWIVSISFGKSWFLTEVHNSKDLLHKTMNELLPSILRELNAPGFRQKILLGYSMGGFNTAQVLLKKPLSFHKYLLLCPAITHIGPQSTSKEVKDYIRRTGANPFLVDFMQGIGKKEFPTPADWAAHSPLLLASHALILPPVYVSSGLKDDYGFQEGSLAFYQQISTKASYAQWMPIPNGRHCSFDLDSITQFILQP